jgi:hypothetical protein
MEVLKKWIWNLIISIDQLANTITGGDPDETICSRAAKAMRDKKMWGCVFCKLLDFYEKDHCTKSLEEDEGKNQVF